MESRPSVRHAEYATGANGRKLSIRRASKAQGGSPRYSQSRRQSSHRRGSNMPRPSRSRSPMPEDGSPRVADRSPRDESPTPGTRPGSRLEKSVDESVKDAITDVQAQPWVRHDEHTDSDESDLAEEQRGEGEEKFAEQRQLYHHQKRASGLSVVSRTKVLRGVPTRLQVLFARQLKCVYFGPEDDEVLCRAGDSSPASNRFMVLDDGICDVLVPGPDGSEVVIGRVGPGSVIGGTLALGLTSTHLMTIRRSRVRSKDSKLEAAENDRDAQDEANTRPIELITHSIHGTDIEKLEEQFKEELDVLRRRVLLDLQRFVVPHIQRLSSNGFFRRYCSAFVKRVVRNMDMRICRPSELIFKENLLAQSMAILFCGKIDFFVAGKKVATQGEPGMCFGEAALLEDHAVRSASVRCNSEADCLICLLQKEDFLHALNEFPEEKNRLEEQVKTKLTRLSMQSVFADCERNFLHFLSATADAVELAPDQLAYPDRETPEALLICQRGELIVQQPSELDRRLRKGEAVGFEAALGLREGPPNYSLRAGESGCLLIRLTYSVLEQALIYFPGQLPAVLQVIGLTHLPEDHAFSKRQNEIWNIVNPLLCQAFMTLDIDQSLCRTLAPFFKPEICDPGCTITEEGKESDEMVLLVHGIVNWSTTDKVTTIAKAPRHFDEGLVMGTQRRHTATITAKSTCVLWLLSAEHVAEMKTRHWSVCKIFEEAAALRRSMQLHLQARLRNMKTFRRFRSEILEIISRNMDIRTYLPKEVIFAAGEEGDCMYILLQGKAEATVNGRIGQLEEGSTFGEMCLFGQVKRTMTVSSASLCICNVVHRDIITFAFTQFPDDKNANRDLGGPPATRGVSMSGGRAKASEEKLFSKKGKRESRSRDYHNKLNKEGNSRISLRTLDACVNRQNQVSTPEGGTPRSGVRRSTKGTTGPRSSKLVTSTSGSNSQLMSRSSIKAAERRSTRATFLKNQLIEDEAFSTSTESDSSEGSPRHHVVKLGRTSWIKSGSSARSSMNPQENQGANSQAQYSRRELDSAFADGELTRDAEVEDLIAGPQELQRRFQHRSCLFDVPTPKVPPADAELYYVAKDAEEKLSRAFRSYMPASSATTSARIHGVPGASRQRDKNGSFESSSFLNDASMSIGSGRPYHIGATYTAPLPPIQHTRPPGSGRVTGSRPKEGQRNIALAGNLQMLAASLLRINNKPTLTNVTLEELEKSAVEDKTLHSGMRELCENPSRATWSDSDSSDDLRGYWHQKKNQASKETSYISADSMRAITAPMLSRSEKHEHLKRSYLALPIMPSVPKKPGKQRPRPPHVRMYEEDYIYEEVPSTVGRHAFEDEEPQEPEKEVIDLESDQWDFIEKDRDKKDVQEEDAEQEQMPQDDELTDGAPTKAEVCFFIRSSVFRKLASRTSDVQRSQPLTLPIQSLSERHENEHLDSMQCPSCGNTYMFDAKFCRVCGAERVQEKKHEEEEDARLKAEYLARVQAEFEARQKAEEEAAEEAARLAAEQEARMIAEEKTRVQAEMEAKRKAEEEARVQAEIEAKQKAEEEDASAGTTEDVVEQHVTGGHSIDIDLSSMTVLDLKAKARELFRQASGQQRQILGSVDFAIARLEEDVARLLQPPVTEASSISTEEHQAAPEEKVPTEASSIPTEEHLAAPEEKVLTEASSIPTEEHSAAPEEKVPEKAESDRVAEVLAKLEALEKQAAPEQDEQYEHLIPSLRPPITSQSREEKGEWTVKGIEERAAARQKTNWFVDEPVEHKEPSTDLKDDFIAQPASWGDFDMEGRLKDVRWDILPPKRSSREQTHRSSRQYLFSNEGEPYFWREAMDKLGGVMIGVGSEQNYLMAGWARPELLILMDLNPAISQLHKAYRVGFELASTPDDFIKLWGDAEGIERMSAGAIEIYGDSQDGEDVVSMITGHPAIAQGLIGLCLRKMKEKYDNLEIPCYLNNQEQYSHIRNLYKTGRVLAILGDLTGTKTMADVSALARDAGLPIRVLYISNAMYQITVNMFDVPPELLERFRDNMLGLPFDEKSLVLHTVQSSAHVPGGMKVTGKNLVRQAYMSQALGQNAPMPSKREPGKSWIFHETRGVEFQEWLENGKKHKEEEERIKAVEG